MTPVRRILAALALVFLATAVSPMLTGGRPAPVKASAAVAVDGVTPGDGYGGYGPPRHQPSPSTAPSPSTTPSATPPSRPSTPASVSTSAPATTLPVTGIRTAVVAAVGGAAVLAGAVLLVTARTRRRRRL